VVASASVGGRAVGAALSPEVEDSKAGALALRLLDAADPPSQTTVEVSGPVDVNSMSFSELIAYADAHGIDWRTRPEQLELDGPAGDSTPSAVS
jgi:hypothetical protein